MSKQFTKSVIGGPVVPLGELFEKFASDRFGYQ
jgi:hypothetical protein